jgi:plastocyanin
MSAALFYTITPDDVPYAQPGQPSVVELQIIVANPGSQFVDLTELQFSFPAGTEATDLVDPSGIGGIEPGVSTGTPWSIGGGAGTSAVHFTALANVGTNGIGPHASIGFTFSNVTVNSAQGIATIAVTPAPEDGVPLTVTKIAPALAVTSFFADPVSVAPGQTVTLTWTTTGASGATLNGGPVAPNGNTTVTPQITTAYTLMASGTTGNVAQALTVSVVSAEIVLFIATPPRIVPGQSSVLSWNAVNGSSATITSPGHQPVAAALPTGSLPVTPSAPQQYTLKVYDAGTSSASQQVTVDFIPVKIVEFKIDPPPPLTLNVPATLSWSVTAAESVTLNGSKVTGTGSKTIVPQHNTVYTLSAIGYDGPVHQPLNAYLGPAAIESFSVCYRGNEAYATWVTQNTYYVTINEGPKKYSASGSNVNVTNAQARYPYAYSGGWMILATGPGPSVASQPTTSGPNQVCPPPTSLPCEGELVLEKGCAEDSARERSRSRKSRQSHAPVEPGDGCAMSVGLTCTITSDDVPYAQPGQPSVVELQIIVANPGSQFVDLTELQFSFPAGTEATDLVDPSGIGGIEPGVSTGTPWSIGGGAGTSAVHFTALANVGTNGIGPGASIGFTFSNVTVNSAQGIATIAVTPAPEDGVPLTVTKIAPALAVTSFFADPVSVAPGQTVTLTWTTTGASSATLNGGPVAPNGNTTVTPQITTAYTLMASGTAGDVAQALTVSVVSAQIVNFRATPSSIVLGQSSILSWEAVNGTSATITGRSSLPAALPSGSLSVSPSALQQYTLKVYDAATSSASQQVSVDLIPVKIIEFTIDPPTPLTLNVPATLSWSVTAAESVTLNGSTVTGTGSKAIVPQHNTVYTLSATGYGGPVHQPLTAYLADATIESFSVCYRGNEAYATWSVHNATDLLINGDQFDSSASSVNVKVTEARNPYSYWNILVFGPNGHYASQHLTSGPGHPCPPPASLPDDGAEPGPERAPLSKDPDGE